VALNCLTRDLQRSNGMQRFGVSLGRTTVIFTRWSCLLLGQGPTAGPPPGRPMAVGCQSLDLRTPRGTPARNPMAPSRACECWTSTSQQPSHATAAQAQACSHLPSPDRDPSGISRVRPHDRDAVRRCADGHDTSVGEGQAPARRRRDGRSLGSGTWRAGWGSRRSRPPSRRTNRATAPPSRSRAQGTPDTGSSVP
jgi:hypothetical protein